MSDEDDSLVNKWMNELSETGKYTVTDSVFEKITSVFSAGCADDKVTGDTIKETYNNCGYLADTHTSVAISVYRDYVKETGDNTPTVIAATASPYKFSKSVLKGLTGSTPNIEEVDMTTVLEEKTGTTIPAPLAGLKNKKVRFTGVSEVPDMEKQVYKMLGL